MSNRIAVALLAAGFALAGCSGSGSDEIGPTDPTSGNGDPGSSSDVGEFRPIFVPTGGVFPYPVDFYFNGSTDGTLNLPLLQTLPNAETINMLDGFSTVASATARFSAPIDPASISAATVFMLEVNVDNGTKATVGFRRLLVYGTDFTARVAATPDSSGQTLEIVPLKPLTPSTGATNVGYLIVLTNGLTDTSGNAATPDRDYLAIQSALPTCEALTGTLNGICLLTGAQLQVAGAVLGPDIAGNAVLTFSFSTQATGDTMGIAAALAQPTAIVAVDTTFDLATLGIPGDADIYAGFLEIPYYLDPAAPLTGYWEAAPGGPGVPSTNLTRFNPVPVAKATLDIPLLVTVPNTIAKPVAGWPVVIFQHGLTGNRAQAAAIAGAYASVGFVVAAIDIPLHGITNDPNPATNPFLPLYEGDAERTFNLDFVNNGTGATGPDGIDDPSGSYIIRLESLLTSRDNLRQAALDIVQLAASLPGLDLDGDTVADIDGARIHFAGLSLGGIVGTVANALPIPTLSAYLSVAGGGVANLLRESVTLGPRIQAGLVAAGLPLGTTLYDNFFRDAQTAVDAGDPLNYIATAVTRRPILLTQVEGDAVFPNSATQRLVAAVPTFLKTAAGGPNPVAAGQGTWVHFNSGSHGSLLSPDASLDVTMEMQTHAASLVAPPGNGSGFAITRPDLLVP